MQAGTGVCPKLAVVVVQLQQYHAASRWTSTAACPPCSRRVPVPALSFPFPEPQLYEGAWQSRTCSQEGRRRAAIPGRTIAVIVPQWQGTVLGSQQ
jgi:hypothetical protein